MLKCKEFILKKEIIQMIKFILIAGLFIVVLFLLLPENTALNFLGIKIIALYFFGGILYLLATLLLWLFFKIKKTPITMADEYIHKKVFKQTYNN